MVLSSSSSFSSHLFILLLLSTLLLYSALAARELRDLEIDHRSPEISLRLEEKVLLYDHSQTVMEGDHYPRVKLHEVHSGPNPISNALPVQEIQNRLPRTP